MNPTNPTKSSKPSPETRNQSSTPKRSSTQADVPEFDPALAMEVLKGLAEELADRRREMKSLQDFSVALAGAKQDDLRIYWDVRVVRGEDTPYHHVQGTSTLPGMLSAKMKAHAPSMLQQEVMDKIAQPLTAVFMQEGELQNFIHAQMLETHERRAVGEVYSDTGDGDSVTRIAADMGDVTPPDWGTDDDD
jgi:hypothetical protein